MSESRFRRIASIKSGDAFRSHLFDLGVTLPFDKVVRAGNDAPLAQAATWKSHLIGNRWCILPMEGWDGTEDGRPSSLTLRRWRRFGQSGAKLIWGGEAVAVCHEGRANPNQLFLHAGNKREFSALREELVAAHRDRFETDAGLLVGLQLTHSGRFCRPNRKDRLEPRIVYHHPILDKKFGIMPEYPVLSDGEIRTIIDQFIAGARMAWDCGFSFVDIKHCHGYLGHEFLSAVDRKGPYGGDLSNRTRFLREIVEGIRASAPKLEIVVRLSAFDFIPFRKSAEGVGVPESSNGEYRHGFGCNHKNPIHPDLSETEQLLQFMESLGLTLVCITAGSPYYNPHIQRPALFPPSDGYEPPEDPLVGVARQVEITARLKHRFPNLLFVGSGYSYLQEFLPNVAQAAVRQGATDFVGLGRMVLAYPELPGDLLSGAKLNESRLCRTFSDCTTAPRQGMVSGCFPLDPFYKDLPEAKQLREIKNRLRKVASGKS